MSSAKKLKLDKNPNPDGCQQFVDRKKRWCRMTVAKGNRYCGEHSRERVQNEEAESTTDPEKKILRIPCPLDPKHSVFTDRLQKHLKICNAREQDKPIFIQKDVNAGSEDEAGNDPDTPTTKLSDLSLDYLQGLVDKVRLFYDSITSDFDPQEEIVYHSHEELEKELVNPSLGQESLKHLKQTSAIIGSLQRLELLQPKSCFIEFGAGKGQVSYYLGNSLKDTSDTAVLLIDRASMRFKMDNKCEDRSSIHRVRADIADLDLRAVPEVKDKERIVGISKHLCGAATDLAIRCMTRVKDGGQEQALVIAVCCHHRCGWRAFVGKKEFQKHSLSPKDFQSIIKMVSWAVCGGGMSRERRKLIEEHGVQEENGSKLPWTKQEQEEIGYMCKRIIDHSRLQYLKEQGYTAGSFYYIGKDVTLENLCIFAKTQNS